MNERVTTVTASQIADLAGVTPSAVSNWRKRFPGFPSPDSSSPGGRDLFSLPEVELWLEKSGRINKASTRKQVLWQATHLLRGDVGGAQVTETLCAAIGLSAAQRDHGLEGAGLSVIQLATVFGVTDEDLSQLFAPLYDVEPPLAEAVLDAIAIVDRDDLRDLFEEALEARSDRSTPSQSDGLVIDLMQGLVAARPSVVFDPAAGEGGFLMAIAQKFQDDPPSLYGQEMNASAWRIARQRFLVHRIRASIWLGDSLREDAFPDLQADLVVCDPPYGQRIAHPDPLATAHQWATRLPMSKIADMAWVQHVVAHLAEHGRGFVLLPVGSLSRGGRDADVRRELVRLGVVSAVIGLGPGTSRHTRVPLAFWVLSAPDTKVDPSSKVLFLDPGGDQTETESDESFVARVAAVLSRWDSHAELASADEGFASAVPTIDLLGADTSLEPARWVRVDLSIEEAEARREALERTLERIRMDAAQAVDLLETPVGVLEGSERFEWTTIDALVKGGLAEVVRGSRVSREDCSDDGVRVLRPKDVQEGLETATEPCHAQPDELRPPAAVTQRGDIVVSPASGRLRAVVDEHGGHILASPLSGVRLTVRDAEPSVVAAFLESPRNRRFATGSAYARVNVRDLEVPVLTSADAARLGSVLESLSRLAGAAAEVHDAADAVKEAVVELPEPWAERR